MKAFAAWILARRHWLALLVMATMQFLPPLACGLLIADGARQGPARAGVLAAIVLAVVVLTSVGGGVSGGFALLTGLVTVIAGFLLGAVLGRSGSLELAFQATVLAAFAVATVLGLAGPPPEVLAAPLIAQLTAFMGLIGGAAEQIEVIRNWDPVLLLGSMFAGVLAQVLAALMLGCWLLGVSERNVAFARQFTALRLGRIVGIVSMIVLAVSLAVPWPAVQYVKSMAVVGFLFQGLAIMHAWLQAKNWHWGAAAAIYAAAVTPLSGLIVTALCAAGLVDNFFSLRRHLRRDA